MEDDDELKRIGEALGWSRTQGTFSILGVGYVVVERVTYLIAKCGACLADPERRERDRLWTLPPTESK